MNRNIYKISKSDIPDTVLKDHLIGYISFGLVPGTVRYWTKHSAANLMYNRNYPIFMQDSINGGAYIEANDPAFTNNYVGTSRDRGCLLFGDYIADQKITRNYFADLTSWAINTAGAGAGSVALDSATKIYGDNSARTTITNAGAATTDVRLEHTLAIPLTGASLTLSFWGKAGSARTMEWDIFNGVVTASGSVNLTTSWQRFVIVVEPSGGNNTLLRFNMGNQGIGDIWIDMVDVFQESWGFTNILTPPSIPANNQSLTHGLDYFSIPIVDIGYTSNPILSGSMVITDIAPLLGGGDLQVSFLSFLIDLDAGLYVGLAKAIANIGGTKSLYAVINETGTQAGYEIITDILIPAQTNINIGGTWTADTAKFYRNGVKKVDAAAWGRTAVDLTNWVWAIGNSDSGNNFPANHIFSGDVLLYDIELPQSDMESITSRV